MGRVNSTGLVYSCTMERFGTCSGIRGNTSRYIDGNGNNLANDLGMAFQIRILFPDEFSEGRLYDQARKSA